MLIYHEKNSISQVKGDQEHYKTRQETFKFWDLLQLILEIWGYICLNS